MMINNGNQHRHEKKYRKRDKGKERVNKEPKSLILSLPDELLLEIFSYLNLEELNQLRLVCGYFHNLAFDRQLFKPIIKRQFGLEPLAKVEGKQLLQTLSLLIINEQQKKMEKLKDEYNDLNKQRHQQSISLSELAKQHKIIMENTASLLQMWKKNVNSFNKMPFLSDSGKPLRIDTTIFKQDTKELRKSIANTKTYMFCQQNRLYNNILACTLIMFIAVIGISAGLTFYPYSFPDKEDLEDSCDNDPNSNMCPVILKHKFMLDIATRCFGPGGGSLLFLFKSTFDLLMNVRIVNFPSITLGQHLNKLAIRLANGGKYIFNTAALFAGPTLLAIAQKNSPDLGLSNYRGKTGLNEDALMHALKEYEQNQLEFSMTGMIFLTYAVFLLISFLPRIFKGIYNTYTNYMHSSSASPALTSTTAVDTTETPSQSNNRHSFFNGNENRNSEIDVEARVYNASHDSDFADTTVDIEIEIVEPGPSTFASTSNNEAATRTTEDTALLPSSTTPQPRRSMCIVS